MNVMSLLKAKPARKMIVVVMLISAAVSLATYMVLYRMDVVYGTGTVRFLEFEGGFYGIVCDDGKHYDPVDLSDEFKAEGLRVRFVARTLHGFSSFHMWGSLVSIIHIEKLQ